MGRKNAKAKRRCEKKRAYANEQDALYTAKTHNHTTVFMVHPYKCSICKRWHLGRRAQVNDRRWDSTAND